MLISQWGSCAMMISLVYCVSSHWLVTTATENKPHVMNHTHKIRYHTKCDWCDIFG